ncbi:MAG TPA: DUF5665 domain-containing protein [Candidatus Saccharibacteria bacterium]|nr:DUF5665 domain-containing protein [Candidatus Saccharibacteria bacterium]
MAKDSTVQRDPKLSAQERAARKVVLEQMFYDMSRSPAKIYWINFFRGIFFGFGSVLGGTLVIAIVLWLLSWLVDLPGGVGDFIKYLVDQVQNRST